jgi:hypothetical protein
VKKEIDKQNFMEFVSKAFDLDSKIEIMFYSGGHNEESSEKLADEFNEIIGGEVKEVYSTDLKTRWFKVYGKHQITIFHHNSHDEKYFKMLSGEKEETA